MLEVLTGFDWLGDQFPTTNQRLAVTVVAVGLLVYALLFYRRLRDWLEGRLRPLYADIIVFSLLVTTGVVTAAVVVGVWGQTAELQELYAEIDLGGGDVARIVLSIILFVSTIIASRVARRVINEVLNSANAVTDHQREVTRRLAQVTIWSIAFVAVLGVWVDDLSGLLVGAGLLGAALGMAARQTIGSMIAGFVLMFSRPFEIGDWIAVEEREGIVTDISIFNTRVRSFDGEYIMVPNDLIASSMVTNRSRLGRLRIEVDVGVDYGSDVDRATTLLVETMNDLELAESAPEPAVVTKGFGDSAVLLSARFWIDEPTAQRRAAARTAAVGAIKETFQGEGIKIPYPQRELSGRAEAGGFRISEGGARPESDDGGADGRGRPTEVSMDSNDPDSRAGQAPTPEDR
ncbi:mechanosensitive ion channel family protein [Halobacteria archaeon AArc-dxtr1]|nr:mechanosensitive ion channel family protein [Halobacteria archaeon AArc-dxtr1]